MMPGSLRKWMPFIGLIAIVIISSVYLFFTKQQSVYVPQTANPAQIYHEACASCHGEQGQGTGLFYPALKEEDFTQETIRKYITQGELFMPAFSHIRADTLDSLIQFVYKQGYKK